MAIYRVRRGARIPKDADPQKIGERFVVLREQLGRALSARDLVDDAAAPTSPLHPAFEWDQNVAADEYRLAQARLLLRSIIEVDVQRVPQELLGQRHVPQEYAVVGTRLVHTEALGGYAALSVIRESEAARAEALAKCWRELRAWKVRWQEHEDVLSDSTLRQVLALIKEAP